MRESLGHPMDSHILGVGIVSCLSHSPRQPGVPRTSQGLPPLESSRDIPRTPTHWSCPSLLSVPQSLWESPGHPKDSHPWQLSQCPICPTVPFGVPIPRTPTLGSCPSLLSVPHSLWESPGHPKDSHPWQLSQCPVCPTVPFGVPRTSQGLPPLAVVLASCLSHSPFGSPQDIPRTLTLGSCPILALNKSVLFRP